MDWPPPENNTASPAEKPAIDRQTGSVVAAESRLAATPRRLPAPRIQHRRYLPDRPDPAPPAPAKRSDRTGTGWARAPANSLRRKKSANRRTTARQPPARHGRIPKRADQAWLHRECPARVRRTAPRRHYL